MIDYRNSIKCKYCAHFQASTKKCFLCHSYDKSLDKDCEKCDSFYQYTEPDSRCEHFTLDAFEVVIKSQLESKRNDGIPPSRGDGSYIVQIPESLRRELEQEQRARYEQLISQVERKAEAGDPKAMKHLGDLLYQGFDGGSKNISLALSWWKKAADHGERSLAVKVAYAYLKGDGCEKDEKLALYYYLMAADYTGDPDAQFSVGLCYENGIGCHANKRKAMSYYELAALQGHAQAQWRLGSLLFTAKKDDGLHWLCSAHLSGVQDATDTLNHFISNGHGNVVHSELSEIKRDGIKRYGRRHEYNRELSIVLSVLKWLAIGYLPSMIIVLIVFGFMLEGALGFNIWIVLIMALFGYLGYWLEAN